MKAVIFVVLCLIALGIVFSVSPATTLRELPDHTMDDLMYHPITQYTDTFSVRTTDGRMLSCVAVWQSTKGDTGRYAEVYVRVADLGSDNR
jgi:hypothetical protein